MKSLTVIEYKQSPGVVDLPGKAASYFAMALKAEADGDPDKAEARLKLAVAAEAAA